MFLLTSALADWSVIIWTKADPEKMLLFFWFPPNLTGVKLEHIIIIRLIFNLMAQISQIYSHRKKSSQLLFVILLTWEFSPALNETARNVLALFWSVIDFTLFNQFLVRCSHPQSCQTYGQDLWWVFWFVCLFVWWLMLPDRRRRVVLKKVAALCDSWQEALGQQNPPGFLRWLTAG